MATSGSHLQEDVPASKKDQGNSDRGDVLCGTGLGGGPVRTTNRDDHCLLPEERASALQPFQTTRDNFLKSIAGLSQKQWTCKSAPDRWSVAEVAQPITVSESTIFGLVQKMTVTCDSGETRAGEGERSIDSGEDARRSHKAQAPEMLRPTGRWATQAESTKTFEDSREATMDYIRTTKEDLRDHFFDHPACGILGGYHWTAISGCC